MSEKRYSLKKDDMYHKAGTVFSSKDGKTLVSDKGVFVLMRYVVDFDDWFEPLSSLSQETECGCSCHGSAYRPPYCKYCIEGHSPHLDRKIEPLTGFDGGGLIVGDEPVRWIQEKSGHEFVKKINELVERFNQLQEVRRP